jgi:hypothetical protein
MSEQKSTNREDEKLISVGKRILFWTLAVSLALALLGSILVSSHRFDSFPIAGF